MKKIYKNVILGLILATILCFAVFGTGYICADTKAAETADVPTEEVPQETEEEKGFIERNLDELIVRLSTDTIAFTAVLGFIIKANKTTKGVLKSMTSQMNLSDSSIKNIKKIETAIDKSNESLEKAIEVFNDKTKNLEEKMTIIFNDNKDNINELTNEFGKLVKAFTYFVEHSQGFVENGYAEEINKIIDGVDENEEGRK